MPVPPTKLSGYVTPFHAIAGKSAAQIEDSLGFNRGALRAGFWVYRLAEMIGPTDFEWKDRTRYSDGWHYDPSINEYVQRYDELRATFGKRHNYDEAKSDSELDRFMGEQCGRLNIRTGWAQIVKVVPKTRPSAFPDSEARNIPQWNLRRDRPKTFTLLTEVGPNGSCPLAF